MVAAGRLRLPAVLLALLAAGLLSGAAGAQEVERAGAIRGTVYDKDFGVPLAGVRVRLVEAQMGTSTTGDGVFVINRVPPGSYTLIFAKPGFERRVLAGVVVTAGVLTDIRADLATEVYEMEELVVTGLEMMDDSEIAALEIRAEAVVLQDSISSELISKAGVSDVGGALKLVVGASVVEGKYATVRGLSDRYTGTTLNGIRVPSADPARRAVQVDLFPTGTLESVTVTKTFTPDLQGDFTGGGVNITTRSVPDGPSLTVSAGIENDSLATGNDGFLTYDGGGAAAFGAGAGARDLESIAQRTNMPPVPPARTSPTPEQMAQSRFYDDLTRSFEPTFGVEPETQGHNGSLSAVGGNRYTFGNGRIVGLTGAVTWSHKFGYYEEGVNNTGIISSKEEGIDLERQRVDTRGTDRTLLGALAKATIRPDEDNEFSLEIIHNQSTIDEARFQEHSEGRNQSEQNQTLRYIERNVTSIQIRGNHTYGDDTRFDWVAARNFTRQYEPDLRFFRNDYDLRLNVAIKPDNSTEPQNTRRIWRDGNEDNYQAAMNVKIPYRFGRDLDGFFKAGFFVESTERNYEQDSFTYFYQSPQLPAPSGAPQAVKDAVLFNSNLQTYEAKDRKDLWANHFLDSNRIGLARNSVPSPNQLLWFIRPTGTDVDYDGKQDIDALYAMAEIPVFPKLKAVVGGRFERTDIEIVPITASGKVDVVIEVGNGDRGLEPRALAEASSYIRDESFLPSVNLIYEIVPDMKLRASYSRTIARPTFREMAPIAQEEFLLGDEFVGNPGLTLSKITNYDLRWEWFPRSGDVLALSAFHKDLRDPIEYVTFAVQSNRNFLSPFNFERGRVTGWEFEGRTSLDLIHDSLRDLAIGVNYTLLDSEVDIPEVEQEALAPFGLDEETRRLQGQPEYIFNANLTYDNERTGTSAGIFYNLIGEVLLSGASKGPSDGNPSVYEVPQGNLDFTLRQNIAAGWSLAFRARNILGDNTSTIYRLPRGDDELRTQYDRGTSVQLSARWSY